MGNQLLQQHSQEARVACVRSGRSEEGQDETDGSNTTEIKLTTLANTLKGEMTQTDTVSLSSPTRTTGWLLVWIRVR